MALVCPVCGTENRSVAKFCIECIAPLPTDFVQTQVLPHPPVAVDPPESMPAALAAFVASLPPPPTSSRPGLVAASPPPAVEARKGLWVSMAALAVALLVGAGGWLIAGAGGWYIYSTSDAPAAAGPQVSGTVQAQPVVEPQVSSAPTVLTALEVTPVEHGPDLPPGPTIEQAESSTTAASVASVAAAPAPAPVRSAANAHPATPDARHTRATERLFASCDGLNFISAARCKVSECGKPQFKQRPECRDVLAQQRLMDEKRNPTAN